MDYSKAVHLANGFVRIQCGVHWLSITYSIPNSTSRIHPITYTCVVRGDIVPPKVVLETAKGPSSEKVNAPKFLRPPLDKLLAECPDMPQDARALVDVLYSTS